MSGLPGRLAGGVPSGRESSGDTCAEIPEHSPKVLGSNGAAIQEPARENAQVRERPGVDTALEKVLLLYGEWLPGRTTVVLVREPVGI